MFKGGGKKSSLSFCQICYVGFCLEDCFELHHTEIRLRLFALSQPIRSIRFSNSHVPIPDWIVCRAGRFIPIHTSLEAKRSPPGGPHQTEWRENLLCKHSTLNVFCCCNDKKMSIDRQMHTHSYTKKSLIFIDRRINT